MDAKPLAKHPVSIAEMARRTGLSAHTLRYYERAGLIRAVSRNASGHRRYGPEDAAWVAFLHRLRETGMPIRQMRAFAQLRGQGDATLAERDALLRAHLAALDERLAWLHDCRAALAEKLAHYEQQLQRQGQAVQGSHDDESIPIIEPRSLS